MSQGGLELMCVSKQIGHRYALRDVSHRFARGTNTAILGRSGSGKSTLLRILAGLEAPSQGRVMLNGDTASDGRSVRIPPHQRGTTMVFQDLALWPNLTAIENVVLGLSGLRLTRREAVIRARAALALCGIEPFADRHPGSLSGGEQQRVALARAIAVPPAYLFLDEPFAGLDPFTKQGLLDDIGALTRESGTTLLLVTHDPWECRRLCTDAAVLEDGNLAECGPLAELACSPRSTLLRSFLRLGQAVDNLERS